MDITVFIRTRNEGALIEECLKAVFLQEVEFEFEVIALDSSSEDDTQSIIKQFDVGLYEIPKALFSYSRALNFGVQKARGVYFVALSGHCVPYNSSWLQELVQPLVADDRTGAVYSRQLPWSDVSPPEQHAIEGAFPDYDYTLTFDSFSKGVADGSEPYQLLSFSNAASCIRRDLLLKRPFLELPFAEDRAFAYECLSEGAAIHYAAKSQVYHSHAPDLKSFRTIAKSAGIAGWQINDMVYGDLNELQEPYVSSSLIAGLKVPAVILFVVAVSLGALVGLYPIRRSWAGYKRLVAFYVASIGTTLGKLEAVQALSRKKMSPLVPADATMLLEQARGV